MVRCYLMDKKRLIGFLLMPALILAVYLIRPSDESRIRKLLREGAEAVESGDLEGIMAKVSFNYRDDYGMTYLYLKEGLKRELGRLSDVTVEYGNTEIKVFERGDSPGISKSATAELDLRVIATSGNETGYILGDIRTPLRLRIFLDKEGTKWLIVRTEGIREAYGGRNPAR